MEDDIRTVLAMARDTNKDTNIFLTRQLVVTHIDKVSGPLRKNIMLKPVIEMSLTPLMYVFFVKILTVIFFHHTTL